MNQLELGNMTHVKMSYDDDKRQWYEVSENISTFTARTVMLMLDSIPFFESIGSIETYELDEYDKLIYIESLSPSKVDKSVRYFDYFENIDFIDDDEYNDALDMIKAHTLNNEVTQ